jgi:methionine sulfoxide reductase catalytic subunit
MTDREWDLPEREATPKRFFTRRRMLARLGVYGGGAAAAGLGYLWYRGTDKQVLQAGRGVEGLPDYKFDLSNEPDFQKVDRPVTALEAVARHVNFYEFNPYKVGTWRKAAALPTHPWEITVRGLVHRPTTFSVEDLERKIGLEQRVYRHRCVETWAMVVPWVGFPLRKLLDLVEPMAKAKYVRFRSFDVEALTKIAPPDGFPWPYTEGLTIAEAANDLAFIATGAYGERLLKQNGAPLRLVVPWKYGFKSAKSLVSIEFTEAKPATFWNAAAADEYGFYANVNPGVDHPRWSQKSEYMIDTSVRHPTLLYNGYGKWVSSLYKGDEV